MKSTTEKIYLAAVRLFAEHGFENVSMRDIAASAGISLGNLQYYFPQKEQLVLSIYGEIVEEFIGVLELSIQQREYSLSRVLYYFKATERRRVDFVHYFFNIAVLDRAYEAVGELHSKLYHNIISYYGNACRELQREGLLAPELLEEEIDRLAYTILHLMMFWSQQGAPIYHDIPFQPTCFDTLVQLLRQHLTPLGRLDLEELLAQQPVF